MKKVAVIFIFLLPYILSCGSSGNHSDQATGSISATLVFPKSGSVGAPLTAPLQSISAPLGDASCPECDTVEFSVSGAGMSTMDFSFSYDAHAALLSNIPPGTGRTVTATIKNVSNETLYTGNRANITVPSGGTTQQTVALETSKIWVQMNNSATNGGVSNTVVTSILASISSDPSGNPVLAWQDDSSGDYEIYVRRWNGSDWVEIGTGSASGGGISNNSGASEYPSVVVDSSGNPVVAWQDDSDGDYEIYIKRWTGSVWEEIVAGSASGGGISANSGVSERVSLCLDSSDNPIVAWQDDSSGDYEIYVLRWNGLSWDEVGTGSSSGGGVTNTVSDSMRPSIAIDSSGNPVLAWCEDVDTDTWPDDVYLIRWNGVDAWVEIDGSASGGGISSNSGRCSSPSLALDSSDNPVVTWHDWSLSPTNLEIYIKRHNGINAWVEIGTGSASGGGISNSSGNSKLPSLALDSSDNPIVAW